ncbi:MAG: sugar phosphate isomerase/epimerase [Crocinitomix sp.]|jgi:sugar phosphate isomerase/epimerase
MAFVSSSCVKHEKIIDSIRELNDFGINALELSGGTKPYPEMLTDLKSAKENLGVDLLLHNYFPPPPVDFVLNLASANDIIQQQSLEHCKQAIEMSIALETGQFGFHAGFFIDIKVSEIGKKLSPSDITDKNEALDRFCDAHQHLMAFAGNDLKLYVENNVFSKSNHESFEGKNPLMLTDLEGYKELKSRIDFNLLLDVAHLKVSCKTLNQNFTEALELLFNSSDYIHVSDNDGLHDTNNGFQPNSDLFDQLKTLNWKNKTVTLEVYEPLEQVAASVDTINLILNA